MNRKKNVLYAVVILNYNTIDDAFAAAISVKHAATTDSYVICIADNGSMKKEDSIKCQNYQDEHIITVCFSRNNGYAVGNNQAIKFLKRKYQAKYYVIMNPDVLIIHMGTIEKMIQRIELSDSNIVGGQPLVWNRNYSNNPEMQQNIRMVPKYIDVCILSFLPLRFILKKYYKKIIYADMMPYRSEIKYQVPSGAFFIINSEIFDNIGMFDEGTFLYFEEYIIGKKLADTNKQLLFMPQFVVSHEHGKSIGNNYYSINKFALKCGLESRLYYLDNYLHVGKMRIFFVKILSKTDIIFQYIKIHILTLKKKST